MLMSLMNCKRKKCASGKRQNDEFHDDAFQFGTSTSTDFFWISNFMKLPEPISLEIP